VIDQMKIINKNAKRSSRIPDQGREAVVHFRPQNIRIPVYLSIAKAGKNSAFAIDKTAVYFSNFF
jgi:hypothetical protein